MNLSKDLVAASATPIVLTILSSHDSYGYAIIRRVQEVSGNEIAWTEGMLYPVLHRLEATGLIDSYWNAGGNGRRRKYYRITPAGRAELQALRSQWELVQRALTALDTQPEGE